MRKGECRRLVAKEMTRNQAIAVQDILKNIEILTVLIQESDQTYTVCQTNNFNLSKQIHGVVLAVRKLVDVKEEQQ